MNIGVQHISLPSRYTACLAVACCALPVPAMAAGTAAGTDINNTATATYSTPQGDVNVASNVVSLRVAELIDVVVASADPADVAATPGSVGTPLKYTVTNGGNGPEAFTLVATGDGGGDDFDPEVSSIWIDSNGNGAYDAGADTVYVAGSNDLQLQADESQTLFVLSSMPGGLAQGSRGRVQLIASALTGTGAPGTSFAGKGVGGAEAVIGTTGGQGQSDGYYNLTAGASAALLKSATVADPFGGVSGAPGAVITYRLALSVSGTGSLANLRIGDPIPAGTTYQAGSLTLDGGSLTDTTDGDAGMFTGTAIAVDVGSVAAGAGHVVTFKTKIN
jgi:uncharacterized repeat protein (TIGR01451 family)